MYLSKVVPEGCMSIDERPFVPVLDVQETPLESLQPVEVQGRDLVVFKNGDSLVAMDRWCPHRDGDMLEGALVGNSLKCPVHGFMFASDTGRGINCPTFSVKVHELKVVDGVVSVRLNL